jgi:predicted nucleic acid-binding protein
LRVYLDSSFVVSLYLTDVHSSEARERVLGSSSLPLSPLHLAEWAHALAQQEFRGNLNPEKTRSMDADFVADQSCGVWHLIALPENAFELSLRLAREHGPKLGVRTLDSLHVACALELKADRFWTFDERQAKLAKVEGLKTSA